MNERSQESCAALKENVSCTTITSQYADVSLPIKLKPCAKVVNLVAECCGEPLLAIHQGQGLNGSCGCEITITQTICIRIPIEYSVGAEVGETTTVCKRHPNASNCYCSENYL